ncbi:hypothetical protein [Methanogenium organophilum]|uniref:Uncharacterized protein n=1 Tax=Methanogenium organophilum TaxID=2199 RepID=A0A9X9T6H6_METOG|nr:hypothetical protein [Methanogenium organophilum]WAI00398.1 hypothetical protein OU421_08135 [Methanogenium organophilum]
MQPADRKPIEEGSPTTKPCANSEMSGTADEQSAAKKINTTNDAGKRIRAGPVPLFLVPHTLSTEIHAHGGDISEIAVKRTGQHVYAITLTKTPKKGHKQGHKQGNKQDHEQDREHSNKQAHKQARNQGREQNRNPGGADAD